MSMGTIFVIGIFGLFMAMAWHTFVAGRDDPESDDPHSLFGLGVESELAAML